MLLFIDLLLFGLAGLIFTTVIGIIGLTEVQNKLQEDYALYGEIVDKQSHTVTIAEIDDQGDLIQNQQLESEEGVSDDLYNNQIIYAYE